MLLANFLSSSVMVATIVVTNASLTQNSETYEFAEKLNNRFPDVDHLEPERARCDS